MGNFTKSDLRDGMFGKFENDNDVFVVVGNRLIYQDGCYDDLFDMTDNLEIDGFKIIVLYEADCFDDVHDGTARVIWERKEETPDESTPESKLDGAITITSEQFLEAVKKANEKFMRVAKDTPGNPLIDVVIGVQNLAFGRLIGDVLFGNEETEEPVAEAA